MHRICRNSGIFDVLPGDCWAFVHEQLKNTLKISTFFIMPRTKQWRLYRPRGTQRPHAHAQLFCYIIQGGTGKSSEHLRLCMMFCCTQMMTATTRTARLEKRISHATVSFAAIENNFPRVNLPISKIVGVLPLLFTSEFFREKFNSYNHVLYKTWKMSISRCCFAEDGGQTKPVVICTCRSIVLFINAIVRWRPKQAIL